MDRLLIKTYKLTSDIDQVPETKGGIYYFKLRFPNNYELGLCDGNVEHDNKINLLAHINKFKKILTDQNYFGDIIDNKKGLHLRNGLKINAVYIDFNKVDDLLFNVLDCQMDNDLILNIVEFMRGMFDSLPPLYIGMTADQSLQSRLKQHVSGETELIDRISYFHLSMSDLTFHCLPLPENYPGKHREVEKLFQNIFKPKLSLD